MFGIQFTQVGGETENPRYMELLGPHHYEQHVWRMPASDWPDSVNRAFKHTNSKIYVPTQRPSELGASGKLVNWDRTADLGKITVSALRIRGQYDAMDPAHAQWVSTAVQRGRYLFCPDGSHMAMYDDRATCFRGLIQ